MKLSILFRISLTLFALSFSSCAGLAKTDRSIVNLEPMSFDHRLSLKRQYPLTQLGSSDSAVSQGCTTCAK